MALEWYIVHTYSGFEAKVKQSLEERIKKFNKTEKFGKIMVPTEQVVEIVNGQKKSSQRKFYPGYMMVQMELDDEVWHLVKDTPKVTGFLGNANIPVPIPEEEIAVILSQVEEGVMKPKSKYQFERGDEVTIVDGPFTNFNGLIEDADDNKGRVSVMVSIFGRPTPVELDYVQISKK